MGCPHFIKDAGRCGAVDCDYHPESAEIDSFCAGEYYMKCGIYIFCKPGRKVKSGDVIDGWQAGRWLGEES